ncbi:MAG: hypothetical protein ABI758_04060 [Candidatus Woesebacteria bacterium]
MVKRPNGFSILEVLLAAAVFVMFGSGVVIAIIQGYNANRLGAEYTIATEYASEGLEAARSIRNQAYSNLVNTLGTGLVRNGSGVWTFSGSNNTLTVGKNYTRTIKVENVNRDDIPPAGNIVSVGGTLDPDTKKITSTVSWNFTPTRPESLDLVTYLTDWKKVLPPIYDGLILYGESSSVAQPKFRFYADESTTLVPSVFNAQAAAGTGYTDASVGFTFRMKTSPQKVEALAGYVNSSGVLRILCFDGTSWSSEWTTTVGGGGSQEQRFDIGYETNTGDALVVYSTNNSASNEMAYRTLSNAVNCGTAHWSAATNISTVRTAAAVEWIRLEESPLTSSSNIALAWADNQNDLSAMQWTGSSFGIAEPPTALETNLEHFGATVQDVLSFDMAYESQTGNLMVVWGPNQATTCTAGVVIAATNCIRYAQYTNAWSAIAVIPTVADPATNIDISGNPTTNELALGSLDNSQADLSIAYWSGSTWTGFANVDITSQVVAIGTKLVATGWITSTSGVGTRYIVVYNDAATTNIGWYVGNGSAVPVLQTDFVPTPVFAAPQRWYELTTLPQALMLTVTDNGSDLFAKRLVMNPPTPTFVWTNIGTALETSLGQSGSSPYSFALWRNPW